MVLAKFTKDTNADDKTFFFDDTKPDKYRHAIMLVAKYSFKAQEEYELDIQVGEVLRFVKRPRNDWVLVEKLNGNGRGLVPASYVDMKISDNIAFPVKWLHEKDPIMNKKKEVNYPILLDIRNVCKDKNGSIWYRIIIYLSNGNIVQMGKYIDSIYLLHIALSTYGYKGLPKVPLPPRFNSNDAISQINYSNRNHYHELIDKADQFEEYLNSLIQNKRVRSSLIIFDFINSCSLAYNNSTPDSQIIDEIIPTSIDIKRLFIRSTFCSRNKETKLAFSEYLDKDKNYSQVHPTLNKDTKKEVRLSNSYRLLLEEYNDFKYASLNEHRSKLITLPSTREKPYWNNIREFPHTKSNYITNSKKVLGSLNPKLKIDASNKNKKEESSTQFNPLSQKGIKSGFTLSDNVHKDSKIKSCLNDISNDKSMHENLALEYKVKKSKMNPGMFTKFNFWSLSVN